MILYHYTTLENFFPIWNSKTLRFSYSKNTNDYFEREKTYVFQVSQVPNLPVLTDKVQRND